MDEGAHFGDPFWDAFGFIIIVHIIVSKAWYISFWVSILVFWALQQIFYKINVM